MKILLIGATGATGSFVLENLLANKQVSEVVIFVRRSTGILNDKLSEIVTLFDELAAHQSVMNADVAISCLGTTLKQAGSKKAQWLVDYEYQLKFAELCKLSNVNHFILLSSLGASAKSKIFYSQMKGTLEQAVKALQFQRLDIVQPSLLIRPNSDRLGERWSEKLLSFFNGVGLLKAYQPIKVQDLGFLMHQMVFNKTAGVYVWTLKDLLKKSQK